MEDREQFQLNNEYDMEDFKKEIWQKNNFCPKYDSLNYLQIQQILDELAELYNISVDSINSSSIFIKMSEVLNKEYVLLDINEKDGFKNLCSMLKFGIHQDSFVYVIWNYNSIDKIRISVLQNYWDYIWYGPSDEACLLYFSDIKLSVMITDYGTIFCYPVSTLPRLA